MSEHDPVPVIGLIIGSGRSDRFAELPARWLRERLGSRGDLELREIDIREIDLPFYDQPTPPARAPRVYGHPAVEALGRVVDAVDGFLVLTPEYNHGYPAQLKNAFDHLFAEFNRKPIAFAGYGNVGAARAIEQLRLVAVELEMAPVRHAVTILPPEMIAARKPGADPAEVFSVHEQRLALATDDLVWWSRALRAARLGESESSAEVPTTPQSGDSA
jgi:NAD(P)H-dependent FMN reductase